jgi:hypothetical protein
MSYLRVITENLAVHSRSKIFEGWIRSLELWNPRNFLATGPSPEGVMGRTSIYIYGKAKGLFNLNTVLIQTARDKAVEVLKGFERNKKNNSILRLKRISCGSTGDATDSLRQQTF